MPNEEKKGITVKIDAMLHAEVRQYVEIHGITMADFVSEASDNKLHTKIQMKEKGSMENMRTVAFQVFAGLRPLVLERTGSFSQL